MAVLLDVAAEVHGLDVRVPEVNPGPDARFENLVRHIREPAEEPLRGTATRQVSGQPRLFRVYRSVSKADDAPASREQMCTSASEMLFRPCQSAR
jgi:hypothetical protein